MEEKDTVPADKHVIQIPAMPKKQLLDDANFVSQLSEEKDTVPADKHAIQIPDMLRKQLLDDANFVTQLGKLVKLPRTPSVDDILKQYLDYKSKNVESGTAESIAEVMKGLQSYFNRQLWLDLLYKQELQQFHGQISVNSSPSTIYGAEHLLRLFVKLPALLNAAYIDDESLISMMLILNDLLKFLEQNQNVFFLSTYDALQGVEASFREEDDQQRQP